MGLEDRAKKYVAARDAEAARKVQQEEAIVGWQERQRARVQEVLSEFIKFVRDYDVAQVSLFYVMPFVKKRRLGKEHREFRFEPIAQVWEIEAGTVGRILAVTEDVRVFPAIRIQKPSGEDVLTIDTGCARLFAPYSQMQWCDENLIEVLQRSELDAFAMDPFALAHDDFTVTFMREQMNSGMWTAEDFPDGPPWIQGVIERVAAAIIDRHKQS